ncbi:chymotrypsin-like elastase family member 1 isoform X1 [Exaiptasia diaphana]|uniref:Peptidase S1 domain-containing protein n=1 Tax=Exaiptasia diaphana TaxID=2652724 RepID=A0A913X6P4_EXADI|nr:chymotrypsin-like elastase family member 1 isoform X1 [Exaiptasia diaphana]
MNAIMNTFLIVTMVFLLGESVPAEEHVGPASSSKRIVNGANADAHEWPWQVSLQQDSSGSSHFCGGSIIATEWVLTAAHCVEYYRRSPGSFQIVVGAHDKDQKTQHQEIHYAKQIYIHTSWNRRRLRADVAFIRLTKKISLHKHVSTIPLPRQGDRVSVGTKCFATGWGYKKGNDHSSLAKVLQEADLTIAPQQKCDNMFTSISVDNTMVCAGGQGKGACSGDSGGPLACWENGQWVLRGIASFVMGRRCSVRHYTVFARVSSFVDWMQNKMNNYN